MFIVSVFCSSQTLDIISAMNKTKHQPLRVTVFGGSLPKPGEPAYQTAYELGKLLGAAGCAVLTGGYIGTMEAVSRGASEAGGHVIGVTCEDIEAWRPVMPNAWIQEERRFPTLRDRLDALVDGCDAAIALPGGVGTLTEITLMWTQMQIDAIPVRPLILVGEGWQATLEVMFSTLGEYIQKKHRTLLSFAPDVRAAFDILADLADL